MRTASIVAAIVLLAISVSFAESPKLVNFQGRLTDAGVAVADGNHSVIFTIYDQPVGGTVYWTETQTVTTTGGLFSVLLGAVNPLWTYFFADPNRYLGITLEANPEMTPRIQLASTVYSFLADRARNADSLGSQTPAYYRSWTNLTDVPAGFADGTDNVGSGDITGVTAGEGLAGGGTSGTVNLYLDTAAVLTKHIANGTIINEDISHSAAISVGKISGAVNLTTTQEITGTKIFSSDTYFGDSTMRVNGNGIVVGTNAISPSLTYMMMLSRDVSTTSSRYGVYAEIDNASTGSVYGVRARASSSTAGAANAGDVYGVYASSVSDGNSRYGVYASGDARTNSITTGTSYGVYARATDGMESYGVKSYAGSASNGYGFYSEVTGNQGAEGMYNYVHDNGSSASIGCNNFVLENGSNGFGVSGTTGNNVGTGYAVYGHSYGNSTNWSGYFTGDVNVGGTIAKSAAKTVIDHPLDPENQDLILAGIDSPEMLVKTSGNAVTDDAGNATVTLPSYFTAVAGNFRYQLTVIGQFAQAIVSEEISGNRFEIKTDKPSVKVSWEITGERIDAYAKSMRLSPEAAKPAEQRGRYRNPEAFGKSPEQSIDYPAIQELRRTLNVAKSAPPAPEEEE